jgi:hypothetical protein
MATRRPVPGTWTDHRLECRLSSDARMFMGYVTRPPTGFVFLVRARVNGASQEIAFHLGFTRYDGTGVSSKRVHVSLSQTSPGPGVGGRMGLVSHTLWADARQEVVVPETAELRTGELVRLAAGASPAYSAEFVVLGRDDVRISHGRWQARTDVLDRIPADLELLRNGRRWQRPPAPPDEDDSHQDDDRSDK